MNDEKPGGFPPINHSVEGIGAGETVEAPTADKAEPKPADNAPAAEGE